MEYVEVKEFLDECVRDFKLATKERRLTNQIKVSVSNELSVLVYKGLEAMADIMGLEIKEEVNSGKMKYRYSFIYDDVEFASYETERLDRFAAEGK